MNAHVHPAHGTSLPAILRAVTVSGAALIEPEAPPPLVLWCASVGRTAADVAALLFAQPMPAPLREVFEVEIRQAIAAEFLARPGLDEDERDHLEDVAWIAFDRRIDLHGRNPAIKGAA